MKASALSVTLIFVLASATAIGARRRYKHRDSSYDDTSICSLPFVVSIQKGDEHHCTGTIVHERVIMTAKKCFKGLTTADIQADMKVVAGTNDISAENLSKGAHQTLSIDKIIEEVLDSELPPSVVLVKLDSPIKLGQDHNAEMIGSGWKMNGRWEYKMLELGIWRDKMLRCFKIINLWSCDGREHRKDRCAKVEENLTLPTKTDMGAPYFSRSENSVVGVQNDKQEVTFAPLESPFNGRWIEQSLQWWKR